MRKLFQIIVSYSILSLTMPIIFPLEDAHAVPSLEPLGNIREGLSVPTRLDLDDAGNLYVADPRLKKILIFDKFGESISELPLKDLSGGGMAVTADGRKIYIACGSSVKVIDSKTGEPLGNLAIDAAAEGSIGFMDIDGEGQVYVADTHKRVVLVFSNSGEFLRQFGDPSSASGKFGSIFALAVDPVNSEIYVADSLRSSTRRAKVMVFSPQGEQIRTLASDDQQVFGTHAVGFFGGIAFDHLGNAYFPDTYRSDIRVVSLPQTYKTLIPIPSLLPNNLERPIDAAFDPLTERLFVACDGGRVEIFGLNGAVNPDPNNPPGMPVLFHPVAGSEIDSTSPQLVLQNAVDPDNDVLRYDVRLLHEGEMIAEYINLSQYLPTSFAQVDLVLAENALYSWTARSRDAFLASEWAEKQTFFVNAVQEAPSIPEIEMRQEVPVLSGSGKLAWLASEDPDPYDTVKYRVEIYATENTQVPLVSHSLGTLSVKLNETEDYDLLEDGREYSWRVFAIDNHQLSSEPSSIGRFKYDSTAIRVDADVDKALVYIGGNHAYPGRYVGETPIQLRDLPPGTGSVVIEASGYETEVQQFSLEEGENLEIYASLTTAFEPDLKSAGSMLLDTGLQGIAPFFVDFNNDGYLDMFAGTTAGTFVIAPGIPSNDSIPAFGKTEALDLPLIPGAVPFVADWNNDGRKDLLAGGDDGTISLFLNQGTESEPLLVFDSLLHVSDSPISVAGRCVPIIIDLDGDLRKDLLVGTGEGEILFYRNLGLDQAPQLGAAQLVTTLPSSATPFAVDWDADGRRDLLVACEGEIFLYPRDFADSFFDKKLVYTHPSFKVRKRGNRLSDSSLSSNGFVPFVFDFDGKKGKDILMGTESGEILLLRSTGRMAKGGIAETNQD